MPIRLARRSQAALSGATWLLGASVVVIAMMPLPAGASWTLPGSGSAHATAQTVPTAATPTVSTLAQDVTVAWSPTVLSGGSPASGYVVRRYDPSLVLQTVLADCASVTTNSCVEHGVPAGTWTYSVQARRGSWSGAESSRSSPVTVTVGVFSITAGQKIRAATNVTGGALSGFHPNEAITFRLDSPSGTLLSASISNVDASGAASGFTVTIPAGSGEGDHTIVAVGGSGTQATSNDFLFDSVVPSNALTLTGAVNAFLNGGTIYFNGSGPGSFTVVDTVGDAGSGPASATFPTFTANRWTAPGGSVSTPAGGPYSSATYSWVKDPATPANQTVTAFDVAGNSVGSTLTFVADTTLPTIVAADVKLAPVGNTTTPGFVGQGRQYYVYAKATDAGSGIGAMTADARTVTAGVTAAPMVAGTYVVAGVTYGWRSEVLTADNPQGAGNRNIKATAIDNVGNTRTSPNSVVVVDNTSPSGAITVPSNGFASAAQTVTSNSADGGAGVFSVQFQYSIAGAGSWVTLGTDTASPFSITWDTTSLTDGGSYDLRVITTDNASNTLTSATVTVTVDRTAPPAPSPPVLAPASDGGAAGDNITNDNTPTYTGTAESGSTVRLYAGVVEVGSATAAGGNWSITASTLSDGAHTIMATATDGAGNASPSSEAVPVTIDTIVPTVTSVVLSNGNVAGTMDSGDIGVVTFSEPMDATTFCSAWSNSGTQSLSNVTITVGDSGGNDTIRFSTPSCTFGSGTWGIGDYVGGGGATSATFTNSSLTWDPTARTLTVVVGTLDTFNTIKTGVSPRANEYTGAAPRADIAGNGISTTKFTHPTATGF